MIKIRTIVLCAAAFATLAASSPAAFAQGTSEQRSACMGDAFRYCGAEIPNVARITACMKTNFTKLSPACKAVMMKG
jgi:hypothetical protein